MNHPKTAIELVPRDKEYLRKKVKEIECCNYDIINLPHLRDRTSKKGEKVTFLSPEQIANIEDMLPSEKELVLHLRTQDSQTLGENSSRINSLLKKKVKEILLITGDTYLKNDKIITTDKALQHIGKQNNISVCLDLYINNWGRFKKKIPFLKENKQANIYTQPIFNIQSLEEIEENLKNFQLLQGKTNIYAGITWITNIKTRDYWKNTNKVPIKYLPKGDTNTTIKRNSIAQTIDILKYIKTMGYSSYIMLMKSKVEDLIYIQNRAENNL